jgi:hypothetical protein
VRGRLLVARVRAEAVVSDSHPLAELTLYGPFEDGDQAQAWAEDNVAQVGDWWLRELWEWS